MLSYGIIMRSRYDAEFWVTIVRSYGSVAGYVLRVVHIALWMTIPTTFWLWLGAPPPAECVPKYGWYKGNALCVSEDAHLFIFGSLFVLGFVVIPFWLAGFWFETFKSILNGDKRLPPVRLRVIGEGNALFWTSLGYWLPAIAYVLWNKTASHILPHEAALEAFDAVMLLSSPFMLLMFWGYLVGLARGVATGERSLVWRRRENIRTALTNIKATLALTVMLIILPVLSALAWNSLSEFLAGWDDLDFMVAAALGSFAFYLTLLTCAVACSHLVASYARKIGIGDRLKDSERLG